MISIIAFAIFLSFFVSSKSSFYLIVFPIALLSALYSPIASVYGAPDYQSFVSLLATNFSEATEFLSLIPMNLNFSGLRTLKSVTPTLTLAF
jgi:glucan phosphoethanolaminetransferase (alkaline phosphatase superfamily)